MSIYTFYVRLELHMCPKYIILTVLDLEIIEQIYNVYQQDLISQPMPSQSMQCQYTKPNAILLDTATGFIDLV